MKQTLNEFKDFIARGNVMDMAVGVIVGGAFGKIVTSLVNDMLMPLIGLLIGGVDLTKLYVALDGKTYANPVEAAESGAPILAYGDFLQNIIDFLIIAFVIFMVIKQIGKMKARFIHTEEEVATTKICPYCKEAVHIEATRCPHCTAVLEDQ
ncbi:large conductance mechanosensitive channel protein MscL [Peptoniphilus sp. EMRHCC_23]|uniref:large conductance mechanosensitive channel protein MscL n=1 Tax=Peptoniphilus rachelemmaiella TaxID=2811779 RepID=UPI001C0027CC|nr:large conductance mechanosensitive channel protein MscL [Peptoniphilus rachelemmaiella]